MRSLAAEHRTTAGRPAEERRTTAAPSVESGNSQRLGPNLAMARSASTGLFLRARPRARPRAATTGLPLQDCHRARPMAATSGEVRGAPRAERCQPQSAGGCAAANPAGSNRGLSTGGSDPIAGRRGCSGAVPRMPARLRRVRAAVHRRRSAASTGVRAAKHPGSSVGRPSVAAHRCAVSAAAAAATAAARNLNLLRLVTVRVRASVRARARAWAWGRVRSGTWSPSTCSWPCPTPSRT